MSKDEKKVKTSPKDFFLHLLSMVALYASAIAFVVLCFQVINIWIPDALDSNAYYRAQNARSAIRSAISFLIVAFPVYLLTAWNLSKSYKSDKRRRKIWVRKWLVYFTLFVAALIIMGSLIVLVNTFLSGDLTLRFFLKFLVMVFVTGAIFGYYLWDEKTYEQRS